MATLPTPRRELTLEQLYLAYQAHIERVAKHVCRRYHFDRHEIEDFVSIVRIKILEDDYAVLRKFQGKSTLETYLTVVVQRLLLDHLDHLWGKWRPSAEAKRLGPVAIKLDLLLHREGLSFDEACQILWTNHHVKASLQELTDLAAKLPPRNPPRRIEGEEALENRPTEDLPPDEQVSAREAAFRRREVLKFLEDALRRLPPEDALLARMSCELKISVIARRLNLEQKPLYRRLEKIFETLRHELEGRGVRPDEIRGLLSIPEDDHEPRE